MQTIGSLKTSDETINQILKNAWWGIASNYKGMPVDCPQRNERQPWLGDRAQGAYGESFLFNNASLYAKWLDDIQQSQTEEGAIPDVAPAFWNYYSDNITWPGTYILLAQMLYHQFNDKQSIVKHYSSMKKWMMYMKSKYLENNILTKDKYGDWCVPPEDLKMIRSQDSMRNTSGQLIATAYYYHLLGIMSDFAGISKNDQDAGIYSGLQENIKFAFNKRFFNKETNQYDNGTVTANLLPFCFGMIPEESRTLVFENILKKLKNDNMHISTGVIGTQWLMRTLTQNGKSEAAFTLASNTTYPSWGYMIKNGATTIWELWNGNTADPKMNSQNHIMLLGDLLIWMFEDIGGITALKPGFREIEMKPAFESGLKYADASYQSVHGEIKSNWSLKNGKLSWKITVPTNTSAVIYIPEEDHKLIKESGRAIVEAEGISLLTTQEGMTSLRLNSGTYFIETLK
jgi:alpha-L-rhamnosidase